MTGEDGKPFDDTQLRDFVLNFMCVSEPPSFFYKTLISSSSIAGRDTTAQTLCWLFYNISQNPRVEAKLREEIAQNFTPSTPIDFETVKNLKYLKAAIDETLRLYPPVPLDMKMAVNDDVLPSGHRIPAGTAVNWAAWPMGRTWRLWDKPHEFYPERWCA